LAKSLEFQKDKSAENADKFLKEEIEKAYKEQIFETRPIE
jgi:hypothetical protein